MIGIGTPSSQRRIPRPIEISLRVGGTRFRVAAIWPAASLEDVRDLFVPRRVNAVCNAALE